MNVNPMILPTLGLGYALLLVGHGWARRARSPRQRGLLMVVAGMLAVPGTLMVVYYLHLFDSWRLFYEFRSLPGSELAAGGLGLACGAISCWGSLSRARWLAPAVMIVALTGAIAAPHAKPLFMPADLSRFRDRWDGAACRQSTGYSCGAASTATILRHYGFDVTEAAVAHECYTYGLGTENWYLARAFRRRGLRTRFYTDMPRRGIPTPCIAGVRMGAVGHFIAILDERDGVFRAADPLEGERLYPRETIEGVFAFTGFFMHVED